MNSALPELGNTVSIPLALCTMSDDLKGGGGILNKNLETLAITTYFQGLKNENIRIP